MDDKAGKVVALPRSAGGARRVFAVALLGVAIASPGPARAQARGPLTTSAQGSFFVGGQDKATDALSSAAPSPGTVTVDQMYVQYQVPLQRPGYASAPVIMIHGCCLTAKSFEETPDGRMGWNEYFLRRGHAVYLPDQVSRGRSGFDATVLNEIALGLDNKTAKDMPYIYSIGHEGAYTAFRFGASVGVPYADEQFPVDFVGEFYKQMVPDLNGFLGSPYPPTPNPTYANLSTLAGQVGGAVIVGHSESGFFPENAALVSTAGIRGMVSLEPGGSCTTTNPATLALTPAQVATLATIPTLVIFGDHLTPTAFLPAYENCLGYAQAIKAAGGDITLIHLPDIGIHGNSHMMMLDRNNLQVADVILRWMGEHVERHGDGR